MIILIILIGIFILELSCGALCIYSYFVLFKRSLPPPCNYVPYLRLCAVMWTSVETWSFVRPLSDVQDQRHRLGLEQGHERRLPLVKLMSGHRGRVVHVPPRLRLSHGRRSHHQQVLQVLAAGQHPSVFGPIAFCRGLSILMLRMWLLWLCTGDDGFDRRARNRFFVAVIFGQVVILVYLKPKFSF